MATRIVDLPLDVVSLLELISGQRRVCVDNAKKDWHPADIIATLCKKGTSMAVVSCQSGLCSNTLANALARPGPKGELLIAGAIGISPEEIWPSR